MTTKYFTIECWLARKVSLGGEFVWNSLWSRGVFAAVVVAIERNCFKVINYQSCGFVRRRTYRGWLAGCKYWPGGRLRLVCDAILQCYS